MKDRIRQIMENAGLSQLEFAARLDISAASLSSIFTGRTNPTNKHVMAVHKAFPQINVNWLLFGEGEMIVGNTEHEGTTTADETASATENITPQSSETLSAENTAQSSPSLFGSDVVYPSSTPQMHKDIYPTPSHSKRDTRNTIRGNGNVITTNMAMEREEKKIKEIRVFYSNGTYESFVPSNKG